MANKNSAAEASLPKDSSMSVVSSGKGKAGSGKKPPNAGKAPRNRETGEWAGPGSVNDERRCRGTARRTGERCKKAAIKGHHYCPSHGGSLPTVRRSAKERLLELVDPALAALHKVLSNENAEDSVKVRAALGILDRTGHGPGQTVTVQTSKWDELIDELGGQIEIDRSLPASTTPALESGGGAHTWEDVETFAKEAQADAWRGYDGEDDEALRAARFNPYDGRTVRGEVILPEPPPPEPAPPDNEPPAYGPYGTR